jgi:hypothetical protein
MDGSHDDGCAVGGDDARLAHIARTRQLNDAARAAMKFRFVYATVGVQALGSETMSQVVEHVRRFDAFDSGNDPWREHDFGSISVGGEHIFWKIDYYDRELSAGSPDPADPAVTSRVLTIMLASEY